MNNTCVHCNKQVLLNPFNRNYNINKHFLICKRCMKQVKIHSKSACTKLFALHDNDLNGLKNLYIENNNNNSKFFLYDDLKQIIINKYGSIEAAAQHRTRKKSRLRKRHDKKRAVSVKRTEKIKQKLMENKLEFKNYGDIYSYINYGEPSIDTIIKSHINKNQKKHSRRIQLAKALETINKQYDESSKICYNYINDIGNLSLEETIDQLKSDILIVKFD